VRRQAAWMRTLKERELDGLVGPAPDNAMSIEELVGNLRTAARDGDAINAMLACDVGLGLAGDMLVKVDRNSMAATLQFYDSNEVLLNTLVANIPVSAQAWTWNGWESDIPFSRIRSTGNGTVNGFIWYENMEVSFAPVPEPSAGALLIGAGVAFTWGRSRRAGSQCG
jgi:hypothetical protein